MTKLARIIRKTKFFRRHVDDKNKLTKQVSCYSSVVSPLPRIGYNITAPREQQFRPAVIGVSLYKKKKQGGLYLDIFTV